MPSNFVARWARRIQSWPARDLALGLVAYLLLGVALLLTLVLPDQWLDRLLGHRSIAPVNNSGLTQAAAGPGRVGQIVSAAARYTLWSSPCLAEALAAKWLLKLRRVDSVVCIGAAFGQERRGLEAHAWLRVGSQVVVGDYDLHRYQAAIEYS